MSAPHPREARTGTDVRLLRAAVFTAVCVALSAAGHVLASCATVPLWTLGAGFLAVFSVAAPLAGRERSLPGIAAALALGQTGLHTLFGVGQHGTMTMAQTAQEPSVVERAARLMCGTGMAAISPVQAQRILSDAGVEPASGQAAHAHMTADTAASMPMLPSLPMLLGHLLAAVVAGWLLRHGDLALGRLVRLSANSAQGVAQGALVRSLRAALALVRALRAGLPGGADVAPHVVPTALLAPLPLRTTALQHSVIRRGPPAGDAFRLAA
ncbi:hypothetical protein EOT10_08515 [Streptomyces antnestii]|uniref:Integral membrane protein n=1 Tax=Streptomyces antnestii TaxID=2494256 RepID=A0A3S2W3T6_9ACTN|nr:hypothetical protein [Streptomyces sp. San01]RVU27209.1 hypothetical protein EOT10_08515 [Streptomyces sp. San01]